MEELRKEGSSQRSNFVCEECSGVPPWIFITNDREIGTVLNVHSKFGEQFGIIQDRR